MVLGFAVSAVLAWTKAHQYRSFPRRGKPLMGGISNRGTAQEVFMATQHEDDFEEGILIYSTAPEKEEESEDDEPNMANIDPRWAALQQLKDK